MPSFDNIFKPVTFEGGQETMLLSTLARRMRLPGYDPMGSEPINLDPDYQRGHVWTDEQAEAFMGHLLEGGATPLVIINRSRYFEHADEVVDGKQRLTAVVRFIKGEVAARLTDGTRVYLRDFSADDQRIIMNLSGPHFTVGYVMLDRPNVLRLYLRLNRGGTVHTDAEIARVQALLEGEGV